MSAEDEVRYSVEGPVARLTINRPERRNALTWDTIERLGHHLAAARDDPGSCGSWC